MTGAMFIAECLKQEGVTKVFGQCGHTNYALIDACHRLGIEYVSFRHEQQAIHAADAYSRMSKKLAVVNVHLSPGLTNAITGVASAAMDGTPMRRRAISIGRSANASGGSTIPSGFRTSCLGR
jgi:acetolactate synthase-1/2/3 large subunit